VWDQENQVERVIDLGGRGARERFAGYARAREEQLVGLFRRHGVDVVDIDTDGDYIMPLTRFFKARSRRR